MKQRIGCAIFFVIGFAWAGFTFFDLVATGLGNCGEDPLCEELQNVRGSLVMWRGLAVGSLLVLAYLFFRSATKDEDVQ